MATYGTSHVVFQVFIAFLLLWGYHYDRDTGVITIEELLIVILFFAPFLVIFLYMAYRDLSKRFGRREMTERERAWEQAWEQLPIDTIVGAIETAFRQSTPDRTTFKEAVCALLTKYEKMHHGRTRDIYARAFEQLLARNDECSEAFREVYEEWYARDLQGGD